MKRRAAGELLSQGCGYALGVPYEFATPPIGDAPSIGVVSGRISSLRRSGNAAGRVASRDNRRDDETSEGLKDGDNAGRDRR